MDNSTELNNVSYAGSKVVSDKTGNTVGNLSINTKAG